jgi:signal peptide peptidase SppA
MKLANVLYKLYVDPWAIMPAAHANLCAIVDDHFTGRAHESGGRANTYEPGGEEEQAAALFQMVGADIALIEINGVIGRRVGAIEKSSGVADVLDIEQAVKAAVSSGAKGILLSFDSPGGVVAGVPELAEMLAQVNLNVPIVSYVDGLCCSAAYWMAAQSSLIVSGKTAQAGSIGVYQAFLDQSREMELAGRKVELFSTGKFKGMGISGLPLSDEQRALLQARVDQVFGWFKGAVANGRGNVPDEAMQGQTYYGEDARKVNLVDVVGSREDAVEELKALIGRN